MSKKRPLKATDRRRSGLGDNFKYVARYDGAGDPLADLFNDRRIKLGQGRRVA